MLKKVAVRHADGVDGGGRQWTAVDGDGQGEWLTRSESLGWIIKTSHSSATSSRRKVRWSDEIARISEVTSAHIIGSCFHMIWPRNMLWHTNCSMIRLMSCLFRRNCQESSKALPKTLDHPSTWLSSAKDRPQIRFQQTGEARRFISRTNLQEWRLPESPAIFKFEWTPQLHRKTDQIAMGKQTNHWWRIYLQLHREIPTLHH